MILSSVFGSQCGVLRKLPTHHNVPAPSNVPVSSTWAGTSLGQARPWLRRSVQRDRNAPLIDRSRILETPRAALPTAAVRGHLAVIRAQGSAKQATRARRRTAAPV